MFIDPKEVDISNLIVVMKGHVFCPACKLTGMADGKMCDMCQGVGQLHIENVPEQIRAQLATQVVENLQRECDCDNCKGGGEYGGKQVQHSEDDKSSGGAKKKEEGRRKLPFSIG